ncbi:hypothetical protein DFH09DRAFT_1349641 [Mycena vulgaris]|nr:hypothetical protein DFH09DRAFT_1349641 [Mycena vulgaris]
MAKCWELRGARAAGASAPLLVWLVVELIVQVELVWVAEEQRSEATEEGQGVQAVTQLVVESVVQVESVLVAEEQRLEAAEEGQRVQAVADDLLRLAQGMCVPPAE